MSDERNGRSAPFVARDSRSGAFGVAIATRFFAVGALCPHAESGVGALSTQTLINPYYARQGLALLREGASAAELGRDVLSRIVWGTRASLLAGVVSVCISLAFGVPIGMLAGYLGGWADGLISRVTDAMLACPFLILAIALAAFLGPSLTNAMIAIGISATPVFIRLTRAQVLAAKSEDYVEAARALGDALDPRHK